MDLLEKIAADYQRWSPVVFYESRNQFFFDVIKDHWKKLIYQLINIWGWDSKWCEVELRFRTSKNIAKVFQDGEEVIVHSGDLKNLRGLVTKAVFGSLANKAFLQVQATKGFFFKQKMQFCVQEVATEKKNANHCLFWSWTTYALHQSCRIWK